ncbi:MAG: carbon-nitrogen hydrolase family protein [Chloroflexi bacterium]|nr:MAG: carbon-nitrogen hydrolase family protein [Chloroflexota bacterium]
MFETIKVAIIQASPIYYDLAASFGKAVTLIQEAAHDGAKLIALGETWLPGYPAWLDVCPNAALWDHEPTKQVFARLHANSITVPGKETEALGRLARENDVVLIIGVNERVNTGPGNGSIYNTIITIDADGRLINHHRKLVPTYTERMVWGYGDSRGLKAVDSSIGRVGGLVCWEHWMPLSRQAMHNSNEHIHAALWPAVKEMHQVASRHYAFEGRCFVLAAGSMMTARDLPDELAKPTDLKKNPDEWVLRGGSAIIAPDGRYLAGPVYEEESIITAELDLSEITKEKMTLDVTGHYSRPDVFEFGIRENRNFV